MSEADTPPAQAFGPVADANERARPSYPEEAAAWMVGGGRALVLELGAGTGKLTEVVRRAGHDVLATDPLLPMLRHLRRRLPLEPVAATAEHIPLGSRSVDVVVCGQSFHWFDHAVALPEIARVLRPGGVLALAWNTYDTAIPWVKRLARLVSPEEGWGSDFAGATPLMETPYFGFVEQQQFRFWQPHTASTLADLARSVTHVATMGEDDRAEVLARIDTLYAEYGRGHDGMQVPYVTRCYRAVVRHEELPPEVPPPGPGDGGLEDTGPLTGGITAPGEPGRPPPPPEDPGTQLIDFR